MSDISRMQENANAVRKYCMSCKLTFDQLAEGMGCTTEDSRKDLSYCVYGCCSDEERDRIQQAAARIALKNL